MFNDEWPERRWARRCHPNRLSYYGANKLFGYSVYQTRLAGGVTGLCRRMYAVTGYISLGPLRIKRTRASASRYGFPDFFQDQAYNPLALSLSPGARLGAYEVLGLIGTGGMGARRATAS